VDLMPSDLTAQDRRTDVPRAGGSIFILNNTTFSGADIKILINIYDVGSAISQQIKDLQTQLQNAQDRLAGIEGALASARANLNSVKIATREYSLLNTQVVRLLSEQARMSALVQSTAARIADISKKRPKVFTKELATIQTLSASTARDKRAVHACGSVYPKGFTRGPRSIAGSCIFTVFNEHVLYDFLEAHASDFDAHKGLTSALLDQLPPVDFSIAFANEYGAISRMHIYGVEFVNEGQTLSIQDLLTENVVQYVARDIDPMRAVSQRKIDEDSNTLTNDVAIRGSDLILEEEYQAVKNNMSPFSRFGRRRNPFI
jgi:hypothetical protein